MHTINRYFEGKPYIYQLAMFCLLVCSIKIILLPILVLGLAVYPDISLPECKYSFANSFELFVFAPLVETFIFQLLVIRLLLKIAFLKKHSIIIFCLSALLFGVAHRAGIQMLHAVFAGVILAYIYHYYFTRGDAVKAFWTTAFVHFTANLLATSVASLY